MAISILIVFLFNGITGKIQGIVRDVVTRASIPFASGSTTLPNTNPLNVEICPTTYSVSRNGFYYWRVRAYNRKWTWYTDWSDTWCFGSFYAP